jgi:PBP superfamily domain
VTTVLPAVAVEISGAGATFPYPLYAKWADTYRKETGIGLNYQSIGSGGGIKQIEARHHRKKTGHAYPSEEISSPTQAQSPFSSLQHDGLGSVSMYGRVARRNLAAGRSQIRA